MSQGVEQAIIDDRYGRNRHISRKTWWIIALCSIIVVVGGAATYVFTRPYNNISFDTIGYTAVSSAHMRVTGQIATTKGAPARCSVQVFSKDFDVVGWKYIDLPSSTHSTRQVTVDVRTILPGVSGGINTCWLVAQ